MQKYLYPLIFTPIFKERIWGGSIISSLFKNNNLDSKNIGEAWLISDRDNENSIVENGFLAGLTIKELRYKFRECLLGTNFNYEDAFPLLIKILHAKENLSIQVHPKKTDTLLLQNAEEKSEFWYILQSNNADIIAGLHPTVKLNNLIDKLQNNEINQSNIKKYFMFYKSKINFLYYIKSGLVHAINKGNLILEIQQNSDTTYRIYDYNRVDESNKPRQLHLKESLVCLKNSVKKPIIKNLKQPLKSNLFNVARYNISKPKTIKTSSKTFKLISIINGEVEIETKDTSIKIVLSKYQTALLPANLTYKVYNKTKTANFLITLTNAKDN
jgi:mannose-6-phosphate isomerase